MRQIALDTETTGLFYYQGHRIIEIGCVEIIDKKLTDKTFQSYFNPERSIDKEAKKITGLTEIFLRDKPLFKDLADNFFEFIKGADEIIIHNSIFDVNFINNELKIINHSVKNIKDHFKILDTLDFARKMHPGKKNNLDALCSRYNIISKERELHGALLDATLLAKVYIEMTIASKRNNSDEAIINNVEINNKIDILKANKREFNAHINYIKNLKDMINIV